MTSWNLPGAALDYWRAGWRVLVHKMREMLTHRIEDVLPRVTVSARVVHGGRDLIVLLVSLAACTVPTLRALRIAPVDALRNEG